ncbi:hypothetical protein C3F34_01480 [Acinetobacter sp. ACNIH2]|uniref:hypothetical protein n=1 Tax=Acinetobacter sp. ACNIH2 TaxID=1758189 RepID=UPI000CDC9FD8|nr:hypothetical protein [Acinetobacter sp. ACNIH2]AUX84873.1 hypothetical protein C3F34_01480 [Acinetobacter sp. ACNIH2]
MARVVSIIPPLKEGNKHAHLAQGTKVLLDDGSYLEGVMSITLKAEVDQPWKAIIEVYPTNQKQIDALVEELKVVQHE